MNRAKRVKHGMTRRAFLGSMAALAGGLLAACKPETVVETVVKEVEKVVKETVVVEGTPQVIEKVVKETVIVEKEPEVAPPENAPIIYWSMFGLDEAQQAQMQVDRFNEETGRKAIFMSIGWGNIVQKVQVAIEGGNPPDLVSLWSQSYTWGPRGLLLPLEDYADVDGIDGTGWAPAAWNSLWAGGHLWGLGHTLNMYGFHVNRTLYEAKGFSGDNPPTTIMELDQMAEQLTELDEDGNLTRLGFLPWQGGGIWHWAWAHGASFYDEQSDKITVSTDERILQTLKWMLSYAEKYGIDNIDRFRAGFGKSTMSSDDPWYVGKVVMQIDGSWKRSWIPRYAPDLDYFVSPSPALPEVGPVSETAIGAQFNIPRGANNVLGAWELAKEFASDRCMIEFALLVGNPPPKIEAAHSQEYLDAFPYADAFLSVMETGGRSRPAIPVLEQYQSELNRAVDEVLHGKAEPEAALEGVATKVQQELDDFREQVGS